MSAHIFFSCSPRRLARESSAGEEGDERVECSWSAGAVGEGSGIGREVPTVDGKSQKAKALGIPIKKGPRHPYPHEVTTDT